MLPSGIDPPLEIFFKMKILAIDEANSAFPAKMGNFCISDEGINGFAARKQKKIHPKGFKLYPFSPKGPKGPRAKMVTAWGPRDNFFSA